MFEGLELKGTDSIYREYSNFLKNNELIEVRTDIFGRISYFSNQYDIKFNFGKLPLLNRFFLEQVYEPDLSSVKKIILDCFNNKGKSYQTYFNRLNSRGDIEKTNWIVTYYKEQDSEVGYFKWILI